MRQPVDRLAAASRLPRCCANCRLCETVTTGTDKGCGLVTTYRCSRHEIDVHPREICDEFVPMTADRLAREGATR